MSSPLRTDPTRTLTLRRDFMADFGRRWLAIQKAVTQLLVHDNAFGESADHIVVRNARFEFTTDDRKLEAFQTWFKDQVDKRILTVDANTKAPWTSKYVNAAYRKGVVRAYSQVHQIELASQGKDFYQGGQAQFLKSAFASPEMTSKVRMLATRNYEKLKGISAKASDRMAEILAKGMAQGKSPKQIAKELSDEIGALSKGRARTIARTEIIYAHAEGQLDAFEALGIDELELDVEWSTAGDNLVCPRCHRREGRVYSIAEARGLIPLHPNCRCCWKPANPYAKKKRSTGKKDLTDDARADLKVQAKKVEAVQASIAKTQGEIHTALERLKNAKGSKVKEARDALEAALQRSEAVAVRARTLAAESMAALDIPLEPDTNQEVV